MASKQPNQQQGMRTVSPEWEAKNWGVSPPLTTPAVYAGTGMELSTSRWTDVFLAVLPAIATNYGASNRKTVAECVSLAASLADEAVKEIERRK